MAFVALTTPIILPWPLQSGLDAAARALLESSQLSHIDFSRPTGEAALVSPDSVSWRVFKNPLSLLIGGVTAVIMELAEPRVRTGVWEHTTFRLNPIRRLRRTGLAAMVTIYGARSTAEAMIARVRRIHDRVAGTTPSGEAYCANDPELLKWVQGTAAYGFLQAYNAYVQPLSSSERDRLGYHELRRLREPQPGPWTVAVSIAVCGVRLGPSRAWRRLACPPECGEPERESTGFLGHPAAGLPALCGSDGSRGRTDRRRGARDPLPATGFPARPHAAPARGSRYRSHRSCSGRIERGATGYGGPVPQDREALHRAALDTMAAILKFDVILERSD
jgi:ER-bound oxygenase mpaB/B'/Rubber oxygenase, catalytic domain